MTIIEFFDKNAIENMLSALLCDPEQVIFIGDSVKRMNRSLRAYEAVLQARGKQVKLSCLGVGKNNLVGIVEVLMDIAEKNPDCVFNLDGGEDLYLVAVGMTAERFRENVKLHRFNVRNNTMQDCDADGQNQLSAPIKISIDENVRIYGGRVIYEAEKAGATYPWEFRPGTCRDVRAMWEVCRQNTGLWNVQVGTLERVMEICREDENGICIPRQQAQELLGDQAHRLDLLADLLYDLEKAGVVNWFVNGRQALCFAFKDPEVRRCLSKAGQILEMIIAVTAWELREDEKPLYNDVRTGVYLDWDGQLQPEYCADISNEIDVLLMKGAVPVFVSCKNGLVTIDELYKLSQVACRFGGKYAKKVLVASGLDRMGGRADYIRARASDMGIRIVENVDNMSRTELDRAIRSLWCN